MQSRQRWGISRLILRIVVRHHSTLYTCPLDDAPSLTRSAAFAHHMAANHSAFHLCYTGTFTHLRLQYTHAFPADLFVRFFFGSSALVCSSGSSFTTCFLAAATFFFCDGPAVSEGSVAPCWSWAVCAV